MLNKDGFVESMLVFENMQEVLEKKDKKKVYDNLKKVYDRICTFSYAKYVILQNRASHHQKSKCVCDTKE